MGRATIILASMLMLAAGAPAAAQQTGRAAKAGSPVAVEYYYRIKWGAMDEFMRLYAKNHAPVLEEMKRRGFITKIESEKPFTHMAGGTRWDLRVTITYRNAEDAVGDATGYEKAAGEVMDALYKDRAGFDAEEAKRFGLLEEHWDVIVIPAGG